uniref:Uncharacterized protein n=1 Tax=Anopheles minimus TaxID=112268 RepID=A0A182WCS2_9DIPT
MEPTVITANNRPQSVFVDRPEHRTLAKPREESSGAQHVQRESTAQTNDDCFSSAFNGRPLRLIERESIK